MSDLLNCPFCDGRPVYQITTVREYVRCSKCGNRTKVFNTKEEAATVWNRRVKEFSIEARIGVKNWLAALSIGLTYLAAAESWADDSGEELSRDEIATSRATLGSLLQRKKPAA